MHPLQTRWLTTASNNDWNKWDNWSNGSPYCCTDAIISSDAKIFPVLGTVEQPADYCCKEIFFEPRSAVENITSLNYRKAWVEMELKPNMYYNLSTPLGIFLNHKDSISIEVVPTEGTDAEEYVLHDNLTDIDYEIGSQVVVSDAETSLGRFVIRKLNGTYDEKKENESFSVMDVHKSFINIQNYDNYQNLFFCERFVYLRFMAFV